MRHYRKKCNDTLQNGSRCPIFGRPYFGHLKASVQFLGAPATHPINAGHFVSYFGHFCHFGLKKKKKKKNFFYINEKKIYKNKKNFYTNMDFLFFFFYFFHGLLPIFWTLEKRWCFKLMLITT